MDKTPRTDALFARHVEESKTDVLTRGHALRQISELLELARQLERELNDRSTVPSSRYWACNADWLRAEENLKEVREVAKKEIERLERDIQSAKRLLTKCAEVMTLEQIREVGPELKEWVED